jgi:hypothetical protein
MFSTESTIPDTQASPTLGVPSHFLDLLPFSKCSARSSSYLPTIIRPPPAFSFSPRPGRHRSAEPQDVMHRTSYGDTVYRKDDLHTRILFQNVKGLTSSTSCEDFKYCLDSLHPLQTQKRIYHGHNHLTSNPIFVNAFDGNFK